MKYNLTKVAQFAQDAPKRIS